MEQPPKKEMSKEEAFEHTQSKALLEEHPEKNREVITFDQIEEDKKERRYEEGLRVNSDGELERITSTKQEIEALFHEPITPTQESTEEPPISKTEHKKPWLKNIFTAGAFTLGSLFASGKSTDAGKAIPESNGDSLAKKEVTVSSKDSTYPKKNTVAFYTESKTKEGAITPTGLNNSFFENEYGLTPELVEKIAEKFNFSLENEASFQNDLLDYLEEKHPEIIKKSLDTFGETAYAKETGKTGVDGLRDGKLGARTAFLVSELNKTISTYIEEARPQPKGDFVINVRGDEKHGPGAYYFFEDKASFDKATELIGSFSKKELSNGDTQGQATYDMNHDVFLQYHAKSEEAKKVLGQAWIRDSKDAGKFIAQ